jgi:ketosteroid isomerase-like protein
MKTRRTTARHLPLHLLIAVATLMSGACLAKDNPRETALRDAEMARFKASVENDAAALERLLDADLLYTHSNGEQETKARFIAALSDGTRDYLAFQPHIESLRVNGNVGLIHGRANVTVGSKNGNSTFDISFDDAWIWKDGRWQLTAWRSTRLAAPPPAARSESGARATVLARFDAALAADAGALDKLLADDLQYCNFQGECWSKQQYVDSVKSGALKYKSIEPTVEGVKLFADTAAASGRVAVTATRDGVERHIRASYLAVLVWRDNRWQLTSWSSTLLELAQAK